MSQSKEDTRIVGICWADPETFWWNATEDGCCPVCPHDAEDFEENHGFFERKS